MQDPNDPDLIKMMLLSQKDACFFSDHLKKERFRTEKFEEVEMMTLGALTEKIRTKKITPHLRVKVVLKDGSVVKGDLLHMDIVKLKEGGIIVAKDLYVRIDGVEQKIQGDNIRYYPVSVAHMTSSDEVAVKDESPALCLYDLHLGVLQSGAKAFTDKELINTPKFARLLVQAKFLSGELIYSAKEKKVLREWLKEHDPQMVEKFFVEHILKNSPDKQSLYPQSALANNVRKH